MRGQSHVTRKVQILATLVLVEDASATWGNGFANVLELSDRALLLESCRSLEEGARVQVSFFMPRRGNNNFEKVSMVCVVARARNRRTLHYEAEIVEMDEVSQQTLSACLSSNRPYEESIS